LQHLDWEVSAAGGQNLLCVMGDINALVTVRSFKMHPHTAAVVSDFCNQTKSAAAKTENPAPLTQNPPPNTILTK